jgi:predicted acetylornithine/succinylornithine family transaminase
MIGDEKMDAQAIIKAEKEYVLQTYVRPDLVFTHGKGMSLFDIDGNEYLDFTSGIAVTALGHSDEAWVTAVATQAARLTHVSNLYHSAPQAILAKQLAESCFADKVFFCNSGAEANEAAIKFARKYAKSKSKIPTKTKIVAFSGSFHGRTMGALAVTYKENYRAPFGPLMPGAVFAQFNDLESAEGVIDESTCAVIVEPVQGEGGVKPATPQFLQGLRELCDAHQALLIFDEVQCGIGRTGYLWAHEPFGVTPDMMSVAKPLAGGLPIGVTLLTQAVADVMQPGDHASTFAAGPLVCAAANVVFARVSNASFLHEVQNNAAYLHHRLNAIESDEIVEVRGVGLMVGVEMKTAVSPLITAAREKGLLIINAGETVLRLVPALTVTKEEIDTAVTILESCLEAS